ncbi:hypothetical protein [Ferroplasma sp.]|uniref:hypothetical protein n=1 Tax=Ferroplasma sp. TaxID=2591003 RepID=UPI0026153ED6|nr:hypothetical protein [Ferroplasma sp.]
MIEVAQESFKAKLIENVLEEILKDTKLLKKFRKLDGREIRPITWLSRIYQHLNHIQKILAYNLTRLGGI